MPAHPCAGRSLLKNGVFQQTARTRQIQDTRFKIQGVADKA
jgi:hypothetical protein